jgi:azurin
MRIVSRVYLLALAVLVALAAPVTAQKAAPRTIVLSANDQMKYSKTELTAKPGEVIKLRLLAVGEAPAIAMRHNFVLLKIGTDQLAFSDEAAKAVGTDYIPSALKSQIVAHTNLVANGQSTEITFTVPAKAGTYPFMCTFPGHFAAGMRGKLIVK